MRRVRHPSAPFSLGVGALALLGFALQGFAVLTFVQRFRAGGVTVGWVLIDTIRSLDPLLAGTLALALLWRARERSEARALALFLALLAYAGGAEFIWLLPAFRHVPDWSWTDIAVNAVHLAAVQAALPTLIGFSALFPVALRPEDLDGGGSRLGRLLRLRAALLRPRFTWTLALACYLVLLALLVSAALGGPAYREHLLLLLGPLTVAQLLTVSVAALLNLRSGYRRADAEARRRLFWIVEGFLAGVSLLLIASAIKALQLLTGAAFGLPAWWYGLALQGAVAVILVGVAIAMFFSGALDPALAIRRTAVFGLVTLTMVFVFAGIENGMQNVVAERLRMSDHLSGLLSAGLVALTFDPIKERFNRLVERWSGRAEQGREEGAPADAPVEVPAHPGARSSA